MECLQDPLLPPRFVSPQAPYWLLLPLWPARRRCLHPAAFDKAVAAGQPVIVDFQASWCPTCKAQKPIVKSLMQEPKMKNVTLFSADYDTEQALKKQLRVAQQSTFVVFKGGKEVGRSTSETSKRAIATLFDKAL